MSYNNSIYSISVYLFCISVSIKGLGAILVNIIIWNLTNNEKIFKIGFLIIFDVLIDIVLTFEFGHDITILKMTIFNKVDYIDVEAAQVPHIVQVSKLWIKKL